MYEEIIFLQNFYKGKWIVENVKPYYKPLIEPTVAIGRHLFWSNFEIQDIQDVKRPKNFINKSNLESMKELSTWLGIYIEKPIYYGDNHCPCQILRNCVHPEIGEQILKVVNG